MGGGGGRGLLLPGPLTEILPLAVDIQGKGSPLHIQGKGCRRHPGQRLGGVRAKAKAKGKKGDYLLFKQIISIMESKEHLTLEGLQKIVNIRATLNYGLSQELQFMFPETMPVPRPCFPFDFCKGKAKGKRNLCNSTFTMISWIYSPSPLTPLPPI